MPGKQPFLRRLRQFGQLLIELLLPCVMLIGDGLELFKEGIHPGLGIPRGL
jgi:hypothetical protein